MARKSKKTMALEAAAQRDQTTCRVGGYVRLSVENSGGKTEDSIENQKSAILTYLRQHPNSNSVSFIATTGKQEQILHVRDLNVCWPTFKKAGPTAYW